MSLITDEQLLIIENAERAMAQTLVNGYVDDDYDVDDDEDLFLRVQGRDDFNRIKRAGLEAYERSKRTPFDMADSSTWPPSEAEVIVCYKNRLSAELFMKSTVFVCQGQKSPRMKDISTDLVLDWQLMPIASPVNAVPPIKPSLDERLKAAGMLSIEDSLNSKNMDAIWSHAGVTDLETFEEWLILRRTECMSAQAEMTLDNLEDNEMFEWHLSHSAAFGEALANFRKATVDMKNETRHAMDM